MVIGSSAVDSKEKLELEREKEREAWKTQFTEWHLKEAHSLEMIKREYQAEFEKMKLKQEMEIQRQKVEFKRQRRYIEGLVKEKEMQYKYDVERLRGHFTFL